MSREQVNGFVLEYSYVTWDLFLLTSADLIVSVDKYKPWKKNQQIQLIYPLSREI